MTETCKNVTWLWPDGSGTRYPFNIVVLFICKVYQEWFFLFFSRCTTLRGDSWSHTCSGKKNNNILVPINSTIGVVYSIVGCWVLIPSCRWNDITQLSSLCLGLCWYTTCMIGINFAFSLPANHILSGVHDLRKTDEQLGRGLFVVNAIHCHANAA